MFYPEYEESMIKYATQIMEEVTVGAAEHMAEIIALSFEHTGEFPRCHVMSTPEPAVEAVIQHNLEVHARKIGEVITIHHDS